MSKKLSVVGSYPPSLKTHPAWQVLKSALDAYKIKEKIGSRPLIDMEVSALISGSNPVTSPDLELKYTDTELSDVLPIEWNVVVMSPSCLKLSRRAATAAKIKTFINAHPDGGAMIAFLHREDPLDQGSNDMSSLQGLMDLHQLLVPILPIFPPVLAIFEPMDLLPAIKDFVQRDTGGTPHMSLVQHTCPFALLSRHAQIEDNVDSASVLSMHHSMRDLSQAIRTESGKGVMNAFFHHGETEKLAQFMLQDSRVD